MVWDPRWDLLGRDVLLQDQDETWDASMPIGPRLRHWGFCLRQDRDETLLCLETETFRPRPHPCLKPFCYVKFMFLCHWFCVVKHFCSVMADCMQFVVHGPLYEWHAELQYRATTEAVVYNWLTIAWLTDWLCYTADVISASSGPPFTEHNSTVPVSVYFLQFFIWCHRTGIEMPIAAAIIFCCCVYYFHARFLRSFSELLRKLVQWSRMGRSLKTLFQNLGCKNVQNLVWLWTIFCFDCEYLRNGTRHELSEYSIANCNISCLLCVLMWWNLFHKWQQMGAEIKMLIFTLCANVCAAVGHHWA